MITIDITGAELKAMLSFVGEEPITAGLCVCPDGRLMATDGEALVVRGANARADTTGRRLIPTAALKEGARAKAVRITVVGETVQIDADGAVRTCVLSDEMPPPFERIFPAEPVELARIGLNPQHIARVATVDKAIGARGGSCWAFSFFGALRPVVAETGTWSVMIMPREVA